MNEAGPQATVLFVVGSGRSGTTVYQETLNGFSNVNTFTRLSGRYPALTYPSSLLRRYVGGPDSLTRPSGESQQILREAGLTPEGQERLRRRLRKSDGNMVNDAAFHRRVRQLQSAEPKRHVVAVKNTLNSARVEALGTVFPDAIFHHVVRHPGRVIESLMAVDFFPTMVLWWDGRTVREYAQQESVSPQVIAARHWSRQVEDCLDGLSALPSNRSATIHYSDFVQQPELATRLASDCVGPLDLGEYSGPERLRDEHTSDLSSETEQAVVTECRATMSRIGMM